MDARVHAESMSGFSTWAESLNGAGHSVDLKNLVFFGDHDKRRMRNQQTCSKIVPTQPIFLDNFNTRRLFSPPLDRPFAQNLMYFQGPNISILVKIQRILLRLQFHVST